MPELTLQAKFFSTSDDIAVAAGFRSGFVGTHTTRTLMLSELGDLFESSPQNATKNDYAQVIIDQNCLGKLTVSTRRETNLRLSTLYSLDSTVPIFRILRRLWELDQPSRPLLALLVALARDPLLRATSSSILALSVGEEFQRRATHDALRAETNERLSEATLSKVVRNAASSWTQSGHLKGRTFKIRQLVTPTAAAAAFALYLGQAAGFHGEDLLSTAWVQVLDCNASAVQKLAIGAKRLGLIDFRSAGGILDLNLRPLDPENQRRY